MKLQLIGSHIALVSESVNDGLVLTRLYVENQDKKVFGANHEERAKRPFKNQVKAKRYQCHQCGKQCKGAMGLGVHRARMHPLLPAISSVSSVA